MPADLVYGVVGISPDTPCQVLFVESLRDSFKKSYELVRVELEKHAQWQKVGYDTNLKRRVFQLGDRVIRYHEPLANLKLVSTWDGPFTIVRIISETTVVMESLNGRLYKSNVARLRPWKGRELSGETGETAKAVLLNPDRLKGVTKRGPGRPRKVVPGSKTVRKASVKKTVSAGEGVKAKKGKVVTKSSPAKDSLRPGLLNGNVVRRSSRLKERAAVT